jgi:hypothetical protein
MNQPISPPTSRTDAARSKVRAKTAGIGLAVAALTFISCGGNDSTVQVSNVMEQGASESILAVDGAVLVRSEDGIQVRETVPTPPPGSYEYPVSAMVQPWATPHPEVFPGSADEPEAFTLWVIAFNNPDLCTDGACDADDLLPDAAAEGGVYQADGRVADESEIEFAGGVRLGQEPFTGATLDNPLGAEIHVFMAPHGKALTGPDLWRQLNGPVGNPALWWAAVFSPE